VKRSNVGAHAAIWTADHIAQVASCGMPALVVLVEQFVERGDVVAVAAVLDAALDAGALERADLELIAAPLRLVTSTSSEAREIALRWGRVIGIPDDDVSGRPGLRQTCATRALAHVVASAKRRGADGSPDPGAQERALRETPALLAAGADPYEVCAGSELGLDGPIGAVLAIDNLIAFPQVYPRRFHELACSMVRACPEHFPPTSFMLDLLISASETGVSLWSSGASRDVIECIAQSVGADDPCVQERLDSHFDAFLDAHFSQRLLLGDSAAAFGGCLFVLLGRLGSDRRILEFWRGSDVSLYDVSRYVDRVARHVEEGASTTGLSLLLGVNPKSDSERRGAVTLFKRLARIGVDLDEPAFGDGRYTALQIVASLGSEDVVRALLQAGADPAAHTLGTLPAAELALEGGRESVAAVIAAHDSARRAGAIATRARAARRLE
jgi:hypothetical protein